MSLLSKHLSPPLSQGSALKAGLLPVLKVSPLLISPSISHAPPPFLWVAELADVSESILATDSFGAGEINGSGI